MMKLPEKDSLVLQTIVVIQEMIHSGELTGTVPGERVLASQLQIGRDTLRSALNELTNQSWISASEQGKRRMVLKKPNEAIPGEFQSKRKKVILLSPKTLENFSRKLLIEFNALRSLLASRDITIEIISPSIFETQQPAKRLEQLTKDHSAHTWILYQCTEPIQRWFQEEGLSCIIRGYPHPTITLPYLDEDWKEAAFHATNKLLSQGHTSIGLVRPVTQLEGLNAAESGVRQSFQQAIGENKLHVIREKKEFVQLTMAIQSALAKENPPTALILTRPRHVLNVITWLASFGLRIPQHLSIVALCHEPWFTDIHPSVNHYLTESESMAKSMAKKLRVLLNHEPLLAESPFVIPEYVEGNSILKL